MMVVVAAVLFRAAAVVISSGSSSSSSTTISAADAATPLHSPLVSNSTTTYVADDGAADSSSNSVIIRGSYDCTIKVSGGEALPLRNTSDWSRDDFNATVRTLLATSQTLYGYRVRECANLEALPMLLQTA